MDWNKMIEENADKFKDMVATDVHWNWVSARIAQPSSKGNFLCCHEGNIFMAEFDEEREDEWVVNAGYVRLVTPVDYWMPLPEPPKEGL